MKPRKKTFSRIVATLATTVMLGTMAVMPAFAAPLQGVDVTFDQTLDMSNAQGAGLPNITFSYAVANSGFTIPESSIVEYGVGTPSIANITFDGNSAAVDDVYTETATVDFSGVTFSKPGIYRYMITRSVAGSNAVSAVDGNIRYLDVYVGWEGYDDETGGAISPDADLVIYNYVLVADTDNVPGTDGNYTDKDAKSEGYDNAYKTNSLVITKNVAGAMGNKSEDFSFNIDLTDSETSSVTVSINNVDTVYSTDNSIVLDEAISDNETITITGLPVGTEYTITETDAEGYETSYSENVTQDSSNSKEGRGTIVDGTNNVTVTNTKDAVTPTGIAMTIAPYAIMVVAAAGVAFLFLRRRHSEF